MSLFVKQTNLDNVIDIYFTLRTQIWYNYNHLCGVILLGL